MFDPSVLNFPTFNTVPDLLDAVVADCHTILENPNYTPLAQEWHTPISHGKTSSCAVCLAGGFLVRQLKPPKSKDLVPSDFPKRVAHILYAVNGIRQGQLIFNLEALLEALPQNATTTLNSQTPKTTVVKMVDFGYTLPSAISENAVCAAPPPQQFKAAPPGNLTREHRTGPYPSLPAGFRPHGSLNRIGSRVSASPAGVALQAPVSTAPESHPSTSTRASLASSRVR